MLSTKHSRAHAILIVTDCRLPSQLVELLRLPVPEPYNFSSVASTRGIIQRGTGWFKIASGNIIFLVLRKRTMDL